MGANWFDSECLLRQVKQCSNLKRAIASHEATFIAISIVLLEATLLYFENQTLDIKNLFDCVQSARDAIDKLDLTSDKFREAWLQLNVLIGNIDLEVKINQFIDDHRGNRMLQFLVQYCNMVTLLFTFIEATRSRNWLLHLDALVDMIPDFASMGRFKYRRMAPVYVADMRHLEIRGRETIYLILQLGETTVVSSKIKC